MHMGEKEHVGEEQDEYRGKGGKHLRRQLIKETHSLFVADPGISAACSRARCRTESGMSGMLSTIS